MNRSRADLTVSCADCSYIPKVPEAGRVSETFQVMHNGAKILRGSYHGDLMTDIIFSLRGHHEPQEEKAFYEILKMIPPGSTMIELGSNWSYYSIWFNKQVQNANNIMIEPDAVKLQAGRDNFRINAMRGTFLQGFIGATSVDKARFVDWDGTVVTMRRMCVDDLVKGNDVVEIVHSDIQGGEYDMLLGCKESIRKGKVNYFFISTHGARIHQACLTFLRGCGYHIVCSHTADESFSGDGLIVASRLPKATITISKRGVHRRAFVAPRSLITNGQTMGAVII